jgi:hypothetical protein
VVIAVCLVVVSVRLVVVSVRLVVVSVRLVVFLWKLPLFSICSNAFIERDLFGGSCDSTRVSRDRCIGLHCHPCQYANTLSTLQTVSIREDRDSAQRPVLKREDPFVMLLLPSTRLATTPRLAVVVRGFSSAVHESNEVAAATR